MDASQPTRAGGSPSRNRASLASSARSVSAGAPALKSFPYADLAVSVRHDAPPIAIADGAPRWIELLPAGVFAGRDGRGPFRLDDPDAVIAATRALGMDAPIDYDHATDFAAPEGRPAPAAGWIRELEVRDGAIWGRVEWTERAAAAIAAREYRYVSPVFQFDPASGRVTRLLRAGLTNNPNLHLTAIAAADRPAESDEDYAMQEFLAKLISLLGLEQGATAEEVESAVRDLVTTSSNARTADPARFVAVAEYQRALTELNALKTAHSLERAEHVVDEAIRTGKLTPSQREWAIAYSAADLRGFQTFVARQPSFLTPADSSFEGRPARDGAGHGALSGVEVAICAQLGVSHADYVRRRSGRADFLKLDLSLDPPPARKGELGDGRGA